MAEYGRSGEGASSKSTTTDTPGSVRKDKALLAEELQGRLRNVLGSRDTAEGREAPALPNLSSEQGSAKEENRGRGGQWKDEEEHVYEDAREQYTYADEYFVSAGGTPEDLGTEEEEEEGHKSSAGRFKRVGSTLGVDEEFEGPDTSSLAAFLFSFISFTPNKPRVARSLSGSSSYSELGSEYEGSEDGQEEAEAEGLGFWEEQQRHQLRQRRTWGNEVLEGEGEELKTYSGAGGDQQQPEDKDEGVLVEQEHSMQWRRKHRRRHQERGDGDRGSGQRTPPNQGGVKRWILSRLGLASDATPSRPSHPHIAHEVAQFGEADPSVRRNDEERKSVSLRGFKSDGFSVAADAIRITEAVVATTASARPHTAGGPISGPGRGLGPAPSSPPRLPALSEESALLTDDVRVALFSSMPAIAQGREWVLLYSTKKHGISLATLYRKSLTLPGPSALVIGERGGAIFGAFTSTTLQICSRRKYQGSSDSFVFSDISGAPEVFKATGANRYFMLCLPESLAFGGGGHFALRLEEDLLTGTSGACETFGNPQLTLAEDFDINHVELWGFAHTSKYTPQNATWHEPAAPNSFHSVL